MDASADNEKTLVISGFGHADCLMAAALLCLGELRNGREPELRLCSREALAAELQALLPQCPKRLILVGIGLSTNAQDNIRALRQLATRGCEICWYSALAMPSWLRKELAGSVQPVVDEGKTLPQLVFELGQPWGRNERSADKLLHYSDYPALPRFCKAAGFVSRIMSVERRREMMRLFLAELRKGRLESVSARLNDYLRVAELTQLRELKGKSARMEALRQLISQAAAAEGLRVLILGETGTGKETVANYIHLYSERWNKPFIAVSCASATPAMQEAAFFGYLKGAWNGSRQGRKGFFEQARGGTLFLDDVAALSMDMQALLLRVLEQRRVLPLGAHEEVDVDVRLIAASSKDLWKEAAEGRFREDLLYRLQEFTLRTPALRDLPEDISTIADAMWWQIAGCALPSEARTQLPRYDWPGNARELFNALKFAHAMGGGTWASRLARYREMCARPTPPAAEPPVLLDEVCALHCRRIADACGGNITQAAKKLGISRLTLRKHLQRAEALLKERPQP